MNRCLGINARWAVTFLGLLLCSCHDAPRDNPSDPAVADRRTIEGDVELHTQEDLEALIERGGGSFEITGSLLIQRSSLKTLNGLNSLTLIGEDLIVTDNDSLASLEGLNNLTVVGRDLDVWRNDSLLSLEGLNGVRQIGRDLRFWDDTSSNPFVRRPLWQSFRGLENLTSVGRDLWVTAVAAENFEGMGNLIAIGRHFFMNHTASAKGLHNLITVGGTFGLAH